MKKKKVFKILKVSLLTLLCLALAGIISIFAVNGAVTSAGKKKILSPEDAAALEGVDCILVLGCYVHPGGNPSGMLEDRLAVGIDLYDKGAAPKILMSGDHGRTNYNEVAAMKKRAIEEGVPSSDVFMDHAGFSTYESVYRAKEVFGAKKILIVTQEYHLYRALHVAEALGVEAYGVSADLHSYWGQSQRDLREVAARCKDVLYGIFRPEPTYLGQPIPLTGDGDLTNDDLSVFEEGQIT
ncbi:MAG: YdcF family protein [Clostridia bacterium]|nr:YdcF family protein [Clostridia bacterium]